MLSGVIILSLILPLQLSTQKPRLEPFIVQAVIDASVILGMPASKAARKYAQQKQVGDFIAIESNQTSTQVNWRRLYFRTHFY
jgi:hypothetical protein